MRSEKWKENRKIRKEEVNRNRRNGAENRPEKVNE